MAVPYTRLASQVLDAHNLKLHDALKVANGVIAVLGSKGRIKMNDGGGPNFKERILYGLNSNVGFMAKNQQIGTVDDEGITMASVPQRVIGGSIVINKVEQAQVRGKWALGNLMNEKKMQAQTTYVQKWAEALLQATPGDNDPYTLLPSATSGNVNGILQAADYASQAGTTAGIDRTANTWWRNVYYNTSIDISSEGGDAALYQNVYIKTVHGASLAEEPDFGLCDEKTLGDLGAAADAKRRGSLEDQSMSKLGFRNLVFYRATLIREASTRMDNKIAFLNTRDLALHVLRVPGMTGWDQNNNLGSVPVVMGKFQEDIDSLNVVGLFYAVAGLVPSQLRTHGLADNIT